MENSIFARFERAFFIFWHFEDVLVLSTTWNDLFCSCVDDVSIWWHIFNFVFWCPKRWLQFNSRIVRTHFSSVITLNNWKMVPETRSYIFRWRYCFCRRRVCLTSLTSVLGFNVLQTICKRCRWSADLLLVCFVSAVLTKRRVFKLNVCSRLKTDPADGKVVCSWSVCVKTDLLQICCRSARFLWVILIYIWYKTTCKKGPVLQTLNHEIWSSVLFSTKGYKLILTESKLTCMYV